MGVAGLLCCRETAYGLTWRPCRVYWVAAASRIGLFPVVAVPYAGLSGPQ